MSRKYQGNCEAKRRCKKAKKRTFLLGCLCGAEYRIVPPKGTFRFECQKCGRFLLSIRSRELNGVALPRYIESVGEHIKI